MSPISAYRYLLLDYLLSLSLMITHHRAEGKEGIFSDVVPECLTCSDCQIRVYFNASPIPYYLETTVA